MNQSGQMLTEEGEPSQRVLFLPGNPHDGVSAAEIFKKHGIHVFPVSTLSALVDEAKRGAGCLLLVDEELHSPEYDSLVTFLENQPEWSDLPVMITFRSGSSTPRAWHLTEIANVTLIERPLPVRTLISSVRSALRDRQRQYEIRQSIANRDNFLAMVVHELRNPLTSMVLAIQFLGDVENNRSFDVIKRQTQTLRRLIDDLADVSQISRGKVSFEMERHDLEEELHAVVDAFAPIAAEKNLTLNVKWPDHPLWVHGDPGRLGQVLGNLVSNAIRYTPEGGRIELSSHHRGDFIVVRVKDNGIGIPADKLKSIFGLFTRVHFGSEPRSQGMGLGLNLANNIVKAHHGELVAESAGKGKGSTFTLCLPAAESA